MNELKTIQKNLLFKNEECAENYGTEARKFSRLSSVQRKLFPL